MGLIATALGSAGGVLASAWKEYFYCEAIPENVLVTKGVRKQTDRGSNKETDNIITSGSVIAVADGQCMIIVEQGKVVELCAEPGEFVYDNSTSPSIFSGSLGEGIKATFAEIGKRFTFGGEAPKDQRIYYFNTKELIGNKYGTPSPVPFRVVDQNIGLDVDISIRCFGEYSYHILNPLLFYTNVCGNVTSNYTRDKLDSTLKTELLTALQPAFAKISEMGIRYSALPAHTMEMADALNEVLSEKWRKLRGIEIVSFGVSSVKASEEDEEMIKTVQKNAIYRNASMANAQMVASTAAAMESAAKNTGGAAMAMMGVNMTQQMGMNSMGALGQNAAMFQQPQQNYYNTAQNGGYAAAGQPAQNAQAAVPTENWTCPNCSKSVAGNFCPDCGTKKPEPVKITPAAEGWTCTECGAVNQGKFCANCGTKKPAGAPQYKCSKCGWTPEDPKNPPKFCPECGDPFGEEDVVQ